MKKAVLLVSLALATFLVLAAPPFADTCVGTQRLAVNINEAPGIKIMGGESAWGPFGSGRPFGGPGPFDGFSPFIWFISNLVGIVLAAGLAALVVALLPGPTAMLARTVEEQPLQSLGYGALATILIPVLFIALALLIIVGWIMIPFVALAIPLIYAYGLVGVSRWLGERVIVATRFVQDSPIAQAVTGAILLGIINLVPIIGWLINFVAALIGLGAVLISNFGTGKPWFGGRLRRPAPPAEQPPSEQGAA